ncbi:class F sortase [Amycolatopsis saalfeldensis]|uniref:Sortase family protein n=1 Tax=Amycolatopsis saalfeldensis TaxID=394193 RepID=A0A1H8U7I9_9PSEU|nr:class F sortase [Amycolatopsis saalfeldensis]SEO98794.1 Sortase family protein [Amycolatopsis saalfeldensis]
MSETISKSPRGRRLAVVVAAAVLGLAGVSAIGYALGDQHSAPEPSPAMAAPNPAAPTAAPPVAPVAPAGLSASPPVSIDIPAIGVSSVVNQVGLNPDGTVGVPQEGPLYDQPAWFRGSPAPGEPGPSVILGHIDSARNGPSVFFDLGGLKPGQRVRVSRADHTAATFEIDTVQSYPKSAFPQQTVYGYTPQPSLRLITCGGSFDHSTRQYRDNTVVFAHLLTNA